MMRFVTIFWVLFLEIEAFTGVFTEESFEATSLFESTANSSCGGDPPTTFVHRGDVFNCSSGDYPTSFLVDNDASTWWQSVNQNDPVLLTFSLGANEPAVSLHFAGIQLVFRSQVPHYIHLGIRGRNSNSSNFALFAAEPFLCANSTATCNVFLLDNDTVHLAFPSSMLQPIAEVSLIFSGINFQLVEASDYALVEVDIYAQVASGFYAKSLDAIRVEGESGVVLPSSTLVPRSSDLLRFSGRGYANLNYSQSERVTVQWMFPMLPRMAEYRFGFIYSSHDRRNRRLQVTVMQNGWSTDARVTFRANCMACTAYLTSSDADQLTEPVNYTLVQSTVMLQVTFSSVDISLDAIVAVPQHFYNPTSLQDFSSLCEDFVNETCITRFLQLSLEFFLSTYECQCMSEDEVCQTYGGQCQCDEVTEVGMSSPIGRRCTLCPFYMHRSGNGCTACTCPNQFDDCALGTGECSACPPLTVGISCDACIPNAYKYRNGSCMPCECDPVGSISCHQNTGQCVCKEGIGGDFCEHCDSGFFNSSMFGCTPCQCGLGSANATCDDFGQCNCNDGVSGLKCSNCSDGFHSLSSQGCIPCFCSNRTSQCSAEMDPSIGQSQEICDCPFPFTGSSCEMCFPGYYLSATSGLCEQCNCNNRAETCSDGNGECIDCAGNSTGIHCELCEEGTFDADASTNLSCQECPCSTFSAKNTSCITDELGQPFCLCLNGHSGQFCNNCSNGYFRPTSDSRCTDCSCNGNIDPNVPESCDPMSGRCLNCINNSTGSECELCQSGYFGNASNQSCRLCDCNDGGSRSSVCDSDSGQCPCLRGISGLRCDRCQEGFWNLDPGRGCQECQCSEASNGSVCDQLTGQCLCKYGVEGSDCSSCGNGFYNFSAEGCTDCNCQVGSINSSCLENGNCHCLPGVTGAKCDQCLPFHFLLSSFGCQPCEGCEDMLRLNLSRAERIAITIQENSLLFILLTSVDEVNGVNSSILDLANLQLQQEETLNSIQTVFTVINGSTLRSLLLYSLQAEDQVTAAILQAQLLQPRSMAIQEHVFSVHYAMQEVFIDTGNINVFVSNASMLIATQVDNATRLTTDVSLITDGSIGLFPTLYLEILSNLFRSQTSVERYLGLSIQQRTYSLVLWSSYNNINITNLMFDVDSTRYVVDNLMYLCESVANSSALLSHDTDFIRNAISLANTTSDATVAQALNLLFLASGDIQATKDILGSGLAGSGESGSGNLISGSGDPDESLAAPPKDSLSVNEKLSDLRYATMQLKRLVSLQEETIDGALNTSSLMQAANKFNSTLIQAMQKGDLAVEAIVNYTSILDMLTCVRTIFNETHLTLQQVLYQSSYLMENGEIFQNAPLINTSNQLLLNSERLSEIVYQLVPLVNLSTFQDAYIQGNSTRLRDIATWLSFDASVYQRATAMAIREVNQTLVDVWDHLSAVDDASIETIASSSSVLNHASHLFASINATQSFIRSTKVQLNASSASVKSSRAALGSRTSTLSDIDEVAAMHAAQLSTVNSSLSNLQSRLSLALNTAAMIDVALQLYDNVTFNYPILNPPASSLESISFVFNPEVVSSGEIVRSQRREDAVMQLSNGSVLLHYGTGTTVSAGDGSLQRNQWYQVYATRDENRAILSLAPLRAENESTITVNATIHNSDQYSLFDESATIGGGYIGCLDHLIINQQRIPLLTPVEDVRIDTCGPRPSSERAREFGSGVWLFGGGSYVQLFSRQFPLEMTLQFQFRTLDAFGVLLFYPSNVTEQYILIYLSNGRVVLEYTLFPLTSVHLETEFSYNSGSWYEISLSMNELNVTMLVNRTESLSGSSTTLLMPFEVLFLGGISAGYSIDTGNPYTALSIAGCIRDFQVGGISVNLEESVSKRVDFSGCPEVATPGVRFMGIGRAEFGLPNQQFYNITFTFRTTQLAALLLNVGNLTISLFHTKLRLDISDRLVLIADKVGLNDNIQHTCSIFISPENSSLLELRVDGTTKSAPVSGVAAFLFDRLFIGGTSVASYPYTPVQENFRGCIGSLILNGRELSFNEAETLLNVSLYGCRAAREQQIPLLLPSPPPPLPPPPTPPLNASVGLNGRNGSFIAVQISEDQVVRSFSIVLQFVTVSSEGLLLYMQGDDFFALQIVSGRLLFSYDLGSGRVDIQTASNYNDGILHTVEVRRSSRLGQLIVDNGLEVINETSPGTFSSLNINSGYLFLGGLPAMVTPSNLAQLPVSVHAFPACFYTLAVNGIYQDFRSPQASAGVEQCLESYSNVVTLYQDSYLLMRDGFDVGVNLNVTIDFRTNKCSGLLIYVASSIYSDHFVVEFQDGHAVLVFDNGPMREVLEYSESGQLCDGAWHSLFVSKTGASGIISVDGNVPQTVTSSCEVCQSFFAVNTDNPLYVGGIPGTVRSRYTGESESFEGCLRNFYIYRSGLPESLVFSQAQEHRNVEFDSCVAS